MAQNRKHGNELDTVNEELRARSDELHDRTLYESLKTRMESNFKQLDDVYALAKQWLMMSGLLYMAVDRDGLIQYVFGRWSSLGWEPADMVGKPLTVFIHPDDVDDTLKEVRARANGGHAVAEPFINRYRCAGGGWAKVRWLSDGGVCVGGLSVGAGVLELECCGDE